MATKQQFDLDETMKFDPHGGIDKLDRHLSRMAQSASELGFLFNRHDARNELQAATFRAGSSLVRLLLSRGGAMAIELRPLPAVPETPVAVAIAPLPVAPDDIRLNHRTSDRSFLERAREAAGTFEILFRDPEGFLTRGSFTTLFVPRGEVLLTPPLSRGPQPGVLRAILIEEGRASEADLTEADLISGFLIGNSVHGLIPAALVSGNSSNSS